MRSARFVCLFVILGNAMLAAQSNTIALINQPAISKASSGLSKPDPKTQSKILEEYGKLPLSFEENRGQTDARVKFLSRGSGYTLFLPGDEAVFSLRGSKANGEASPAGRQLKPTESPTTNGVLRMKLVRANPAAKVIGEEELAGNSNYFIGNDPKKWRTNVPEYSKVKYEGIYSGIDLVYYGNQRQLEYDFVVAPGADPHRIQFDVRGAKKINRDEHGDLVLQTSASEVRWVKPVVYQERNGTRQEIAAHYVIKDKNRVGFEVADYDLRRPLFIDPLVYSTYLGGSGADLGYGIAVDSSGNAYVTGTTSSTNFPTMNPLQPANGGGQDVFVSELNPTGSALVYSTYLGGSGGDLGYGIAVDSSGNAYVTGTTSSTNFPTMNPLQPAKNGRGQDAFVTKIAQPSPTLMLVPPNLDFGNQMVGTTSSPQITTLTNKGELTLTITSIQITGTNSGDFDQTNNCPGSVPPNNGCQISVTFTPTATGTRNAAVSITDNAPDSPQSVPLTGVGVLPAVTFSPTSLNFGNQGVGTTSSPQVTTLTTPAQVF
jgi:Beta-propeller repeat/Abnormal spindle-like microcephaly-assoc'd, ASPM-SPD-2-Hydin